jgi:hypothetical protein
MGQIIVGFWKIFVVLCAFVVKMVFIRDIAGIIGRQEYTSTGPPAVWEKERMNIRTQEPRNIAAAEEAAC